MAEKITTCDDCGYDGDFEILNPEILESGTRIVNVQTQCPECGYKFEYPTWSNRGRRDRNSGRIW